MIFQVDTLEKGWKDGQGPDDSGLMDAVLNPGAQILSCRWLIAIERFLSGEIFFLLLQDLLVANWEGGKERVSSE